ncbi:hypothetical protein [Roseospira visakhapatnamensis]|uniref:Flagellar protein FlgN n=1 Tax=Roseospira visakhapatnamensis TaxID=390880 RepID=A0A7W6W943_9PROT|nr:hypothetical protein [Roseospira visakhapatnamensis]MBB4265504.1 hypothetical protein [Roseospira visakhapatnamensis]
MTATPKALPEAVASRSLLDQYLIVLHRLIELAELERSLLDQGVDPGPLSILKPQEALANDYTLLGAALKPKVRLLHEAGLLDVEALEGRIRHLVALTKENRRRRRVRDGATRTRVDAVMQALPDTADDASAIETPNGRANRAAPPVAQAGGLPTRPTP